MSSYIACMRPGNCTLPAAAIAPHTSGHVARSQPSGLLLRTWQPELTSLAEAALDVSEEELSLEVAGLYSLQLKWPTPVDADNAKAKFLKKSKVLQLTLPSAGVCV